jgi:hypothetical protein
MSCPGSLALEADCPNTSSKFSDEGTAAHELAAMCLVSGNYAATHVGERIDLGTRTFEVTRDMADHVQTYIDAIHTYVQGGELMVEQRVDYSEAIGQPDSFGTSDVIILSKDGSEIQVHDLKFGMGVKVDADENEQLMLYAIGALNEYGLVGDFKTICMVIHQPRLNHLSEWSISLDELMAFKDRAKKAAEVAAMNISVFEANGKPKQLNLEPGDAQCRFCKAKAMCPALLKRVMDTVADDFVDLDKPIVQQLASAEERIRLSDNAHLAECLGTVDMIESWCKAVRAKVEAELFAGHPVPGYKLVEGRRGSRKWIDEASVEQALRLMRIDEKLMYDFSLISPTTADKVLKKAHPEIWETVKTQITQAEGKPSVAPESDKRPAISTADDFQLIEA